MCIDATLIMQARAKIESTVRKMLGSECSYIEGVRVVCDLIEPAHLKRNEQPFILFSSSRVKRTPCQSEH